MVFTVHTNVPFDIANVHELGAWGLKKQENRYDRSDYQLKMSVTQAGRLCYFPSTVPMAPAQFSVAFPRRKVIEYDQESCFRLSTQGSPLGFLSESPANPGLDHV
jgi:hypothetical protein